MAMSINVSSHLKCKLQPVNQIESLKLPKLGETLYSPKTLHVSIDARILV